MSVINYFNNSFIHSFKCIEYEETHVLYNFELAVPPVAWAWRHFGYSLRLLREARTAPRHARHYMCYECFYVI